MKLSVALATPVSTLVLIGGGEFSFGETREIDELLLARMPRDRRTIAFLPTASGSAEYAVHFGAYVRNLDPTVEVVNVPIYRGRDARRQKSLNAILAAGLVYLGGGVSNNLLATLRESPADVAMRDAAANGAVIAAIGAAASCFGTFARDMRGGTGALPALGWLARTAVETGFDAANDAPLRRLMSLSDVDLGLGIPAKTALVIDAEGNATIVGDGQIAAFRKR
ncbi:MAG: Type 1 glutamine amidotransferase-like domain-containing protein [Acidobacteria bacterium]|nr:Type 1 glutamine amidotransferase-like domain-containing protein [Acidobacteriota bacterium]MBV9474454.1 Type 1 glutamine amidotransferase-like domain-containing protein [Acidobacteriota bacterium]